MCSDVQIVDKRKQLSKFTRKHLHKLPVAEVGATLVDQGVGQRSQLGCIFCSGSYVSEQCGRVSSLRSVLLTVPLSQGNLLSSAVANTSPM